MEIEVVLERADGGRNCDGNGYRCEEAGLSSERVSRRDEEGGGTRQGSHLEALLSWLRGEVERDEVEVDWERKTGTSQTRGRRKRTRR